MSTAPGQSQPLGPKIPESISLPVSPQLSSTTPLPLRRLLDETSDLIDSPMFTHVLTLLLDATFSQLVDKKLRSDAYRLPSITSTPMPAPRISEVFDPDPSTASAKLATILAVMTKEAHSIGNGVPNEYVQAVEDVSQLEAFSAVVYSSNFEFEAGFEVGTMPESAGLGSEDEGAEGNRKGEEVTSDAEAEETVGIVHRATGIVDAVWGGFESVWGKVVGSVGDSMTG